ncbi:unnamed protein product [Linum tenue]|uniref:Bifunctional inhibitor/plant lipid transfer protein/seed storage helical domain-containing protein n=1 Tax=Linum tenue TaxID=586396 RepID=A0AAV0QRS5_9ROSI|nr:unnamed protein product [Linum tenue]
MPVCHGSPPLPTTTSSMAFFLLLLLATASATEVATSQSPTITDCTPGLLQLTPCSPFVQGLSASPLQSCCSNLLQLYHRQPSCLCLVLNAPDFGGFPINTTLASRLPFLCDLHVDPSAACSSQVPPAGANLPASPRVAHTNSSTDSIGHHPNSTVPAFPVIQAAPRPAVMGIGGSSRIGVGRQVPMMLLLVCLWQFFFVLL